MTYEEAVQQLAKPKDNMLVVDVDYSTRILLPYEDGFLFIKSLKHAEILKKSYDNSDTSIRPMNEDLLKTSAFSYKTYQDIKVAQLMGISYKDFLERKM